VTIDAAGFITIKGRAKRFAKIAGEMVSLSAVEAMAAKLWPQASGASELAVPAVIQVVDKLPLLGSGKTDYVAATALAKETAVAPERDVA
jgi:acyl-[acyl-carrier-protein]-phospholipid O-acyltransferase/long-chain-fatty-acid--[acyl-carrier-protein] ligase